MEHKDISYVVFESICSRLERTIKRLWILTVILVVLLVGTNCAWLYYESQFETVATTNENYECEADNGGIAIANGEGEVNCG
ncbi:MAG: hypothetical protein II656_02355 [Ruminococcus sp.]|nr:hypothetical protein [Ruminococcus sp.]